MMLRVWAYEVTDEHREEFERRYGAEGDWARLFARSPRFAGTELFGSLSRPGRYLTIDRFHDEAAWQEFRREHDEAYSRLDAESEGLTVHEWDLGTLHLDQGSGQAPPPE